MKKGAAVRLSKLISFALRHDPVAFGLLLDEQGWVGLAELQAAIAAEGGWGWVTEADIRQVVEGSDKQRFEIRAGAIRARYGHSRAAKPRYQPVVPPPVLYHGTPRRNLAQIRRQGLRAMDRQYVHLSADPAMAGQVGRRRDQAPAMLKIRAAAAHAAGVVFGTPSGRDNDTIYLVEALPAEFIEFPPNT